jgi:hypothetical protein
MNRLAVLTLLLASALALAVQIQTAGGASGP